MFSRNCEMQVSFKVVIALIIPTVYIIVDVGTGVNTMPNILQLDNSFYLKAVTRYCFCDLQKETKNFFQARCNLLKKSVVIAYKYTNRVV